MFGLDESRPVTGRHRGTGGQDGRDLSPIGIIVHEEVRYGSRRTLRDGYHRASAQPVGGGSGARAPCEGFLSQLFGFYKRVVVDGGECAGWAREREIFARRAAGVR